MEQTSTQQQVLNFFAKMVEHGYPNKIEMLAILLFAGTSQLNADEVLNKATLSPEEKFAFFDAYGATLLSKRGAANISRSLFWRWLGSTCNILGSVIVTSVSQESC